MNPVLIQRIAVAFSMRREIKLIAGTIAVLCLLPALATILVTQAGISVVSNALATRDPQSVQVDIHNPSTGAAIAHVDTTGIWPVRGVVTLEFGESDFPYQVMHTGIDIASPGGKIGDPVAAFMAGTVIYSSSDNLGFGNHVIIDHGNNVTSIYGHLDTLGVVKGQRVQAGTIIGTRGTTGWSTGPHLHFQIDVYGIPVNPRTFLTGNP
jgi:murein DD-endopeptidase MepM/ murein hydrolase activator NlpD